MFSPLALLAGLVILFPVPIWSVWSWIAWRKRLRHLAEEVVDLKGRVRELERDVGALPSSTLLREHPTPPPPKSAAAQHAPPVEPAPLQAKVPPEPLLAPIPNGAPEVTGPVVAGATCPGFQAPPPPPTLWMMARERLRAVLALRGVEVADWESVVGDRWLNKIGIVVLVIGVALFLGYSLRYMGPLGKLGIGLLTSLILLIGGVYLERAERYTLFAKSFIGGGWALLYSRRIQPTALRRPRSSSPIRGLVLLGLVAGGMILYSLKYRSEIVTGVAYLLGFATVAISQISGFTLLASLILGASLVPILRKTGRYSLGLFGIAATYLNHLIWLGVEMGGVGSAPEAGIQRAAGVGTGRWQGPGTVLRDPPPDRAARPPVAPGACPERPELAGATILRGAIQLLGSLPTVNRLPTRRMAAEIDQREMKRDDLTGAQAPIDEPLPRAINSHRQ